MRTFALILAVLAAVAANLALWALPNRPVHLPPLPVAKLQSVSYAPFRDGQSPLTATYPTRQQIAEDIALLSSESHGLRTYTSLEGMEIVPAYAQRHGMTVTMGAWLDWEPAINEREVTALIALANTYPETITRVLVGSEALLRGSSTAESLIPYLDRVRAAVSQPVSYADVWEFWLRNPQLAAHVDFITIHVLPYWEDVPAAVDRAEEHLLWAVGLIKERFPDKPVLIGEIGWPTAGRMRGPAEPGLVNKARFVNTVVRVAEREGVAYNIIEAFDQNWKIHYEGTVGGHWGLFNADREPKFNLAGPVVPVPVWPWLFLAATCLGLLGFWVVIHGGPPPFLGQALGLGLLTQVLASMLVLTAFKTADLAYYPYDRVLGWSLVGLQGLVAFLALKALGRDRRDLPISGGSVVGGLAAMLVLSLIAVTWCVLLVTDGRYRDFPIVAFLLPSIGVTAVAFYRWGFQPATRDLLGHFALARVFGGSGLGLWTLPVGFVLTLALIFGAGAVVISEGLENRQALAWAGEVLLLAWLNGATALRSLPPKQRTVSAG